MRRIDPPADSAKVVFIASISRIEDVNFKIRLDSIVDKIQEASDEFEEKVLANEVHLIMPSDCVDSVTAAEMKSIYTGRFVGEAGPGRPFYNIIRGGAPNNICPLCGQGQVTTLDHYLPKSAFPALAVVPLNLVPACYDCNTGKRTAIPTCAAEATIHPYFDSFEEEWLCAEVISDPPGARYSVCPIESWTPIQNQRVANHLKAFKLKTYYSTIAAGELTSIKGQMQRLFKRGGINLVREELSERELSNREDFQNSWRTALYKALAKSDWYCNGGFARF